MENGNLLIAIVNKYLRYESDSCDGGFPGITEFWAGICGNSKDLQIYLIFVQNFECSLS